MLTTHFLPVNCPILVALSLTHPPTLQSLLSGPIIETVLDLKAWNG